MNQQKNKSVSVLNNFLPPADVFFYLANLIIATSVDVISIEYYCLIKRWTKFLKHSDTIKDLFSH
jgi:hypothetical protein